MSGYGETFPLLINVLYYFWFLGKIPVTSRGCSTGEENLLAVELSLLFCQAVLDLVREFHLFEIICRRRSFDISRHVSLNSGLSRMTTVKKVSLGGSV